MSHRIEHLAEGVTLHLGDCREILPTISGIDAIVTDPPYGISYVHGEWKGKLAGPSVGAMEAVIGDDAAFDPSHLLNFRQVILFGANNFSDKLPASRCWLVWDKRVGMPSNDQADCEMAWTKTDAPSRLIRHVWNGMLKASERGSARVHPTQKPISVMEWCLNTTTGKVCDPYMGSGTTGIASVKLGRPFVGIEISQKYFDISCRRIADELARPNLFGNPFPPVRQEALL